MTSITLSGALSLISTNGDGPQLLTEAAEFVNGLAQMGVVVAVEISLRPVAPEKTIVEKPATASLSGYTTAEALAEVKPVKPEPPANPQTPSLKEAGATRPDLSASMSRDEQRLYDSLTDGTVRWLKLPSEERTTMVHALGRSMTLSLGWPLKMTDWDSLRPSWAPGASALPTTYGGSWVALRDQWSKKT